jgi:hypothetical protein
MMQTPPRVQELPSPPYFAIKQEDEWNGDPPRGRVIMTPVATMKALFSIYEIMRCSTNLDLNNSNNPNAVDHHYNQLHHVPKIDLAEVAKDQERAQRLLNNFQMN